MMMMMMIMIYMRWTQACYCEAACVSFHLYLWMFFKYAGLHVAVAMWGDMMHCVVYKSKRMTEIEEKERYVSHKILWPWNLSRKKNLPTERAKAMEGQERAVVKMTWNTDNGYWWCSVNYSRWVTEKWNQISEMPEVFGCHF